MANKDDPAKRSYPANITVICELFNVLDTDDPIDGQVNRHVINLTIIAFYWLLRPAEYTHSRDANSSRSQAFTFGAACITVKRTPTSEPRMYCATDPSLNDVQESQIFAGSLTFADQKNGVRGEQVAQRANRDPDLCPAKALFRLTQHIRDNRAPPLTPLCAYYDSHHQLSYVKSQFITNGLRHAAGKEWGASPLGTATHCPRNPGTSQA
jgi:hypothetical protein